MRSNTLSPEYTHSPQPTWRVLGSATDDITFSAHAEDARAYQFFQGLDAKIQKAIHQLAKPVTFSRGESLIKVGDEGGYLFFILSGQVKVTRKNNDRQLCLSILTQGDCFGELSVIDNIASSASVTVIEDGEALMINRQQLFGILHQHPEFLEKFLIYLSGKMRTVIEDVCSIALDDVYCRLRRVLYRLAVNSNGILSVRKTTHLELSEMVGASREMISIIIKELRLGEYITTEGRSIRLLKILPQNR